MKTTHQHIDRITIRYYSHEFQEVNALLLRGKYLLTKCVLIAGTIRDFTDPHDDSAVMEIIAERPLARRRATAK